MNVDQLWHSSDPQVWKQELERYWDFVKPRNVELEESLEALDLGRLRSMDGQGWYDFLHDEYFPWKFTVQYICTCNRRYLREHVEKNGLDELDQTRRRLLGLDLHEARKCLDTAMSIPGLAVAGASGLLALMYPHAFGTVDQFVVRALREVSGLPEEPALDRMAPKGLTPSNGVVLIDILKRKAIENNRLFGTTTWTPRKIDKVLWTYGRTPGACHSASTPTPAQQREPERPVSGACSVGSAARSMVPATIRGQSQVYADGTERLEVWVYRPAATHLPAKVGARVPISLCVGGKWYDAGMGSTAETAKNPYVWLCGDVIDSAGRKTSLARVLRSSGFVKNQKVVLDVEGNRISVKPV
ncbi:MAG TPA: hypothetical protein VNE39_28045 [Planctomycetota bacterium]|nr:hypothetical protein [Planctomycetota bacterium]